MINYCKICEKVIMLGDGVSVTADGMETFRYHTCCYDSMISNFDIETYRSADLDVLSVEDRVEIFLTILAGSTDITKSLIDELMSEYDVEELK